MQAPVSYLAVSALRRLWRFRLRSTLAVAAAALGVAGFIASVDDAAVGRRRALDQIRRLGTATLVVTAQQSRAIAGRARTGAQVTTLVEQDYRAVRRDVAGIERASRRVNRGFRVKGDGYSKVAQVVGCEPDFFAIRGWAAAGGALFDGDDLRRSRRVAVLGHTLARDLFGDPPAAAAVGRRLAIGRVPFVVVGVLAERGPGLDLEDEDGQVYVPLTAAMRRLLHVDFYSSILIEMRTGASLDRAAAAVAAVLRRRHGAGALQAGGAEDFQVQRPTALAEAQLAAAARLAFLVRWVGASALLVSGLGILAIAWIGVRARTVEIGTRRALGATSRQIFAQLLGEAALLAVAGCGLGLAAGWGAAALPLFGLSAASRSRPVFDAREAAMAVACALALHLVFGLLPARRAARLDPIHALRWE